MLVNLLFGSLILLALLLLLDVTDYINFGSKVWALNVQCINTAPCTQSEEKIIQCVGDSPCVGIQPPNLNIGDLNSLTNKDAQPPNLNIGDLNSYKCNDVLSKSSFGDGISESKIGGLLDDPNLEDNLFDGYDNYGTQCHHD